MSLYTDLLILILQFCKEENLKKTAHMLEQETACFFDINYFEELLLSGDWDEVERYLSGFIAAGENKYSMKIYFEIRKQKFIEALDEHDPAKSLDILLNDLKVFEPSNKELIREMTELLTLDDFRKHASLSWYGDTMSARKRMINELKNVIGATPKFQDKLHFPKMYESRLRRLINQSLNWQHVQCAYPHPEPQMTTLFLDHKCPEPDQMIESSNHKNSLVLSEAESPFAGNSNCTSTVADPNFSGESVADGVPRSKGAISGGVKISSNTSREGCKRTLEQINSSAIVPSRSCWPDLPNDFPKTVERILDMASSPTSMDFHPSQETLLLVGNKAGDVELWDVCTSKKLIGIKCSDWMMKATLLPFFEILGKEPYAAVTRVCWSPDGTVFGVAYSKHIVQLYSYQSSHQANKLLEIDAHTGSVNDLAFSKPFDKLLILTCGDDKYIQVWDASSGVKQFTFEGHGAPVYSLCPHVKEDIHFVFSAAANGEMMAWVYDSTEPRFSFNTPRPCCMRMAYCSDGNRLFSCGTNNKGESSIVEWNETGGVIVRIYRGLCKSSSGVVQFGIFRNRYLVAGDDHLIKVWDIDNPEMLSFIDAGDLDETPSICLNKKGTLLAVSANQNKITILADEIGSQLLQTFTFPFAGSSRCLTASLLKDEAAYSRDNRGPQAPLLCNNMMKSQSLSRIVEVSGCQSLRLPGTVKTQKICRLQFTNAGEGIMALSADGIHLLWKWPKTGYTIRGEQANTKRAPQVWKPSNGLLMINELKDNSFESSSSPPPCFALSKNDSYLVSASGGTISLFNTVNFKKLRSFMAPPPATTSMALYPPDNNIIAIGMDDATIIIFNVRLDKTVEVLKGHTGSISGLAFSVDAGLLVSCGVDAQLKLTAKIVVWDSSSWEEKMSTTLVASSSAAAEETYLQFHKDQLHFLAFNETQLAVYEATTLQLKEQWVIGNFCARISYATYSCDGNLLYVVLRDGIILILGAADLIPRFEIDPSVYLPSDFISRRVYPSVIAAHPKKANLVAVGLTDGGVIVIESQDPEGDWNPPSLSGLDSD